MFNTSLKSFILCTSALLGLFLLSSHAQAQPNGQWNFTYFAGDPPVWHNSPESYAHKAECEIARATKTKAGYPVGDCVQITKSTSKPAAKKATEPQENKAQKNTQPKTQNLVKQQEIATKKLRAKKLMQGCMVACNDTQTSCQKSRSTQDQCVQKQNEKCIERCTSVEQLPYHQCINEVCLPNDINKASWQGLCESIIEQEEQQCSTDFKACTQTCQATYNTQVK